MSKEKEKTTFTSIYYHPHTDYNRKYEYTIIFINLTRRLRLL